MDMLNDDSGAFPVRREANSQAALGQSRWIVAPSAVTAYRVLDEFNATAVNGRIWPISAVQEGSTARQGVNDRIRPKDDIRAEAES
jgi:hypothetical protein